MRVEFARQKPMLQCQKAFINHAGNDKGYKILSVQYFPRILTNFDTYLQGIKKWSCLNQSR